MIEALFNLQNYRDDMGPPEIIACLGTISFTVEEKYANVEGHNPPIYIQGFLGISLFHVIVYNGPAINIILLRILLAIRVDC